jgi:hypothetical protein
MGSHALDQPRKNVAKPPTWYGRPTTTRYQAYLILIIATTSVEHKRRQIQESYLRDLGWQQAKSQLNKRQVWISQSKDASPLKPNESD